MCLPDVRVLRGTDVMWWLRLGPCARRIVLVAEYSGLYGLSVTHDSMEGPSSCWPIDEDLTIQSLTLCRANFNSLKTRTWMIEGRAQNCGSACFRIQFFRRRISLFTGLLLLSYLSVNVVDGILPGLPMSLLGRIKNSTSSSRGIRQIVSIILTDPYSKSRKP